MWNNWAVPNTPSKNVPPSQNTNNTPNVNLQPAFYPNVQNATSTHSVAYPYSHTAYYQQHQLQTVQTSYSYPYNYNAVPAASSTNVGIYGVPPPTFQAPMYPPTTVPYPPNPFAYPPPHTPIHQLPTPTQYVAPPIPMVTTPYTTRFQTHPFQSNVPRSHPRHDRGGHRQSKTNFHPRHPAIKNTPTIPSFQGNANPSMPPTSSLPSSFSCQPCNLQFPTSQSLEAHIASHVTCHFPACTFTGSRKVVSGHYASVHGKFSGRGLKTVTIQLPGSKLVQRFKICVGNHPEDIQAWIEERKKKYPTRQKVLERQDKKRKRDLDPGMIRSESEKMPMKRQEGSTHIVNHLRGGEGIVGDSIAVDTQLSMTPEIQRSALSSLLLDYGSSSSDHEEEPIIHSCGDKDRIHTHETSTTIQENMPGELQPQLSEQSRDGFQGKKEEMNPPQESSAPKKFRTRNCKFFVLFGSCKNGDQCNFIHDMEARNDHITKMDVKRQEQSKRDKAKHEAEKDTATSISKRIQKNPSHGPSQKSLLRKLLDHDMRRERLLTLQLLRYIVDRNYMQPKKVTTETSS